MKRRSLTFCCLIPVASFLVGCSPATEEPVVGEWRQFRGPDGLGISMETDLPVRWREGSSNISWQAAVAALEGVQGVTKKS